MAGGRCCLRSNSKASKHGSSDEGDSKANSVGNSWTSLWLDALKKVPLRQMALLRKSLSLSLSLSLSRSLSVHLTSYGVKRVFQNDFRGWRWNLSIPFAFGRYNFVWVWLLILCDVVDSMKAKLFVWKVWIFVCPFLRMEAGDSVPIYPSCFDGERSSRPLSGSCFGVHT